jgi:hypothetical protein
MTGYLFSLLMGLVVGLAYALVQVHSRPTQFSGKDFGHVGSTSNLGTSLWVSARQMATNKTRRPRAQRTFPSKSHLVSFH